MQWWHLTIPVASLPVVVALVFLMLLDRVRRAEHLAMHPHATAEVAHGTSDRVGIVVFGATTTSQGPSRELIARLRHAESIWATGDAQMIAVSGGTVGDLDEVADMAAYLRERGIPPTAVVEARPGSNTRQTIRAMHRIGIQSGLDRWIAVSTPFHARRIRDEARRLRLRVRVSGPPDSPEMVNLAVHRSRVMTEALATVYYVLPAWLTSRIRTSKGTWRHQLPRALARSSMLSRFRARGQR
jgi:uncharacterized SAM-binding protein YcdF (DUF218 family)